MMFEFCFCAILISARNQNNNCVLFNLSEKNKETGIKSTNGSVQVQCG